ncbi:sigma-54-dependent transcriptional regulator [Thermodesulforhabdus norvegica]|uniref:Regulatory protein, Fis family n=1 Tax=Thermodesulforhabdus norvegica TaxID=39841 RepID=A0A1I4SEF3_9BACT|nr:sigma-54 dependent transcriptional regulator [Thermodesulforhabdus norvegica]SFM62842.1 regulatory protein, Fis family [Thermodesulforhabdus norvegica]
MKSWQILIVEDDPNQLRILSEFLKHKGYRIETSLSGREALQKLSAPDLIPVDVIILDWKLPDVDGLSLLKKIKEEHPLIQVIMLTAFGSVERAVEAMRRGAYHYLTKPVNLQELLIIIEKAIRELKLQKEVEVLRKKLESLTPRDIPDFIAESPKMKELLTLVSRVAETDATVLILGESGTGKEVVARLIHSLSSRRDRALMTVNCAAIPEGLLESELFGHEKGAFTGAHQAKPGLFELAHRGSLFLDEIGDMSVGLQAKLLRVLQNGTFHRVGGTREMAVDVRIIAATNRDLESMVKEGTFREDLFWRLNVFSIYVPPLRARKEDIPPLVNHFLRLFSGKHGKEIKSVSREVMERLLHHDFPGNVRELENIVERAVIMAEDEIIRLEDLPPYLQSTPPEISVNTYDDLPLPEAVALLERTRIRKALEKSGGVKTRAAEMLGISERVLRYKLEKYGIDF